MTDHRADAERALDCIDASDDPRNLPAGLDGIGHALLAIHDTLAEIRDRLPERVEARVAPFDPDVIAANLEAIKHELETPVGEHGECCEPVGVTQDQRVGTRIVDRDGDVWERREEGWSLWHSSEWGPWRGQGRWPQPPGNGILRPATPADLARVGIEDEPTPTDDLPGEPDEALARVIFGDAFSSHEGLRLAQLDVARAAREHIEAEDSEQSKAWLTLIRHPVAMSVGPLAGRSYIDALLDRLTEMQNAEAERDGWKAKHAALRADVGAQVGHIASHYAKASIEDVLDRDDERTPQAD